MPTCKQGNQRWRRSRPAYRPPSETITPRRYEVAEEKSDAPVKAFIERHHYAGTYPAARFRFTLRHNGRMVGAAVFSVPMNPRAITNVFTGVDPQAGVELGRFVLLDQVPGNGESWFLAQCFARLRKKDLRGVVSFSDPMPRRTAGGEVVFRGHLGTIYQASNARYLGRSSARNLYLLPGGRVLSPRAVSKIRSGRRGWRYAAEQLVAAGAPEPACLISGEADPEELRWWLRGRFGQELRRLRHHGNHKYAWSLNGTRLERNPDRYPKAVDALQLSL